MRQACAGQAASEKDDKDFEEAQHAEQTEATCASYIRAQCLHAGTPVCVRAFRDAAPGFGGLSSRPTPRPAWKA